MGCFTVWSLTQIIKSSYRARESRQQDGCTESCSNKWIFSLLPCTNSLLHCAKRSLTVAGLPLNIARSGKRYDALSLFGNNAGFMSPYDNVNGFWLSLIAVPVEAPAHFTFMVLMGILLWPKESHWSKDLSEHEVIWNLSFRSKNRVLSKR